MIAFSLALAFLGALAFLSFREWMQRRYTDDSVRAEVATFRSELTARMDTKDKAVQTLQEAVGSLEFRLGGGG